MFLVNVHIAICFAFVPCYYTPPTINGYFKRQLPAGFMMHLTAASSILYNPYDWAWWFALCASCMRLWRDTSVVYQVTATCDGFWFCGAEVGASWVTSYGRENDQLVPDAFVRWLEQICPSRTSQSFTLRSLMSPCHTRALLQPAVCE